MPVNHKAQAMFSGKNLWDFDRRGQLLILVLLALIPFSNSLFHGFVLDDKVVFTENQFVHKGIRGIPEIFANNSFEGYFTGSGKSSEASANRYRPLSLAFFAIQHQLVGANPIVAHALHLLLYGLLCILIYQTLSRLLRFRWPDRAGHASWFAALFFAVLPLHAEVVANVKSLDEIFALGFGLLSLNAALSYQEVPRTKRLWLAGIFMTLAAFSKEHALSFVLLIPIALWGMVPPDRRRMMKPAIVLVAGAAIYLICRVAVLGTQLYEPPANFLENPFLVYRGDRLVEMKPGDRYGTVFYTLLRYLYLHIVPYPLTHDYAPKSIATFAMSSPAAILSALVHLSLVAVAAWWRSKRPVLSFAIAFYFLTLLPASNLVVNTGAYMGERFAFAPSLGLCIALGWLLSSLDVRRRYLASIFFAVLTIAYSVRSFARSSNWHDNLTLFRNDIDHSSNSAKLNSSLGFTLLEQYRISDDKEANKHLLTQAIPYLTKAVKIYPRYADCLFLLGNAYYLNKEYPKAVGVYEKYIDVNPGDASIIKNYQRALREWGKTLFYEENNNSAAKNALLKSLKLNDRDDQVLEVLGAVEAEMGYLLKSLEYLLRATEINPKNASTWANLYITYTRLGDKAMAQQAINKGMEIDPDIVKRLMSVKIK